MRVEIRNTLFRLSLATLPQSYSKTIVIGNANFTYIGTFDTDNSIKVSIVNSDDATKKKEFQFFGSDATIFLSVFQRNFLSLDTNCTDAEKDILLKEGNNLWFQLLAIRPPIPAGSGPEAGQLTIAKKIKYYVSYFDKNKTEQSLASGENSVQDVSIEFNNGYIENIAVTLLIQGKPITYTNVYGIGFSSIENQDRLNSIRLLQRGAESFPPKNPMDLVEAAKIKNYSFIYLGELLQYKNKLEVDRRDYSPRDISITVFGGQSVTLYKEETNKLFEAHIFSDFIGLQEDKPNGLIQTEVEKRININTRQIKMNRRLFPLFKSFGIFQYVQPTITLSKLEKHNKKYVLGDLDSIRYKPGINTNDTSKLVKNSHRYATPLDLYQHQSFSVGADLNVFFLSNHNLKFNIYFNIGGRLGITPVVDSLTHVDTAITKTGITREYSINTLQIVPQIKLVFLPEERFNFSLSYQALFIKPFASGVELLGFSKDDPGKFQLQRNKWLNTMEMLLCFNVNKSGEGKVFARARFISEIANYKSNFAQIQIGYSTYIFGKAK
jgi:outer membrane lipoprotein-sorting protein